MRHSKYGGTYIFSYILIYITNAKVDIWYLNVPMCSTNRGMSVCVVVRVYGIYVRVGHSKLVLEQGYDYPDVVELNVVR